MEGTSYPSLLQRNVSNLPNIVISSLLQFTQMIINYATGSSIMSIMPGQKNIENLLFHIFRGLGAKHHRYCASMFPSHGLYKWFIMLGAKHHSYCASMFPSHGLYQWFIMLGAKHHRYCVSMFPSHAPYQWFI